MIAKLATHEEKLQALRAHFIGQLPDMMEMLSGDCARAIEGPSDADAQARAQRQAHTLAGTAGAFKLAEISACARDLEDFFLSALEAGKLPEPASLRLRLAALKSAVVRIPNSGQSAEENPR